MSMNTRLDSWNVKRAADESERARVAELNAAPPRNDERLLAPVRVKVLRPFRLNGEPQKVGATVTLPKHDADSLCAIGRAELIT